ncbi:MAG: hypothetical protein EPO16_11960 [Dehalococcoidia bacterium]|nr:MAG: hypothetical protein EPO16_11960 [Dehalococcoidia bacterium]
MKRLLAGLGLAGLVCLPCVLIGGVVSLALIGGTLGAFATNPLVQVAGLAFVGIAAVMFWRGRHRAPCAIDAPPRTEHDPAPVVSSVRPRPR